MTKEWGPDFPHLRDWIKTSEPTQDYNCVAHACDDNTRWWDPLPPGGYYWPDPKIGRDLEYTVDRYVALFEYRGYERCAGGEHIVGKDKIVIYADSHGIFEHVAKQLPNGKWTSKIDIREDITHDTPHALSDGGYGKPVVYMEKKVTKDSSSEQSSSEDAPRASDANPNHQEDFRRLVGAAARKPEPKD
jgi:hypothetical protein